MSSPAYHSRPRGGRLPRLLLLVVAGALALSGCDFSVYSLPLPGGAKLGERPYTVTVEFRDVLDLVPQSSVKVDDVSVGRVEDVRVEGYHAEVTLALRRDVRLPDNATAKIRQTSLLGEKFVSLAPPATGASTTRLGDGDVIPLSRTGRNPEVEEVLGALSLLLNGGGVAQLKTISTELNKALAGREPDVRSVLTQLRTFTSQLDVSKGEIVRAIESVNRLAKAIDKQKPAVTAALDQLPRAVASLNRQRDDLVRMLRALARLSDIGTKVITQSKVATIDSLESLAPTLTKLAESGEDLPKALQIFLTYPFVDAVVGENPAQARNLHLGDYTNLSIQLDLNLRELGQNPVCQVLDQIPGAPRLCGDVLQRALDCLANPSPDNPACNVLEPICKAVSGSPLGDVCSSILGRLPDLPSVPNLPTLSALQRCLASGQPLGSACDRVDPLLIAQRCAETSRTPKPDGYDSETCRRYRELNLGIVQGGVLGRLPVLGNGGGGGGGGGVLGGGDGGGILGGGGVLGGLNRPGFGASDRSPGDRHTSAESDLGALLVWGMVPR